ncbi:D123-domain-containing protein [Tricholoma matsutake]|nr:D123-domain-containing protein [Tricholoma matsutake 945]
MSPQLSALFPTLTTSYILAFQLSSWYPQFAHLSIKSTIIRPLSQQFCDYLDADGVFVPEGSDDVPTESTLTDDDEDDEDPDEPINRFSFPELDTKIRECIKEYGSVFPKLNFSSPKDASWILPPSSPLKCTSPADVYLLLKSSDFISHDISTESVFEGCDDRPPPDAYRLELVLRKWYSVDRSRELRCFVRSNILIGISQRDTNYYEFLNDPTTRDTIISTVQQFWQSNIETIWKSIADYTFDLLLTRDLTRAHILDFNPYAPRTDSLLFTYDDLFNILLTRNIGDDEHAELRVVDSRTHPAATSNAPAHQHNMVPFEALSMSSGRDIEEFADVWRENIQQSMTE